MLLQNIKAEQLETQPIIFGDFMKMGVDQADRMYEELANAAKLKQVLMDVSTFTNDSLFKSVVKGKLSFQLKDGILFHFKDYLVFQFEDHLLFPIGRSFTVKINFL